MNGQSDIYIVQEPIVAAIIISYLNCLNRVRDHLATRGEKLKLKLVITHQIYLETLLDRFHRKDLKKGSEIAATLNLPFRGGL